GTDLIVQGDFQKAVICVLRCKDMLMKLPEETRYLSILCHNFGVETYELKRYEQSSFWLSLFSFQAKVLRLLATAYFEWDCNLYLDEALKAVSLANQEDLHPAGLFLKIKILLKIISTALFCLAVAEILHHEMSLDLCLNTAKLLLEHRRESVGFDFLKSVSERFESSPNHGRIALLHIEFLLQSKRELLAKQKVEEIITGYYTGKQLLPEALDRLHIILWDVAAKHYEAKSYSEALHWYNYSASFYTPGQIDQNLAKLQRNMASCYLHLKQVDKAKEAVKEAKRCDPNSIFTKFIVYKIAVMEKDANKGRTWKIRSSLQGTESSQHEDKLRGEENTGTKLLNLAVQIALENEQQVVAIKALEYLAEHLQDRQQLFTALKITLAQDLRESFGNFCFVVQLLGLEMFFFCSEGVTDLLNTFFAAHKRLAEPFTDEKFTGDMKVLEAHWFRKIGRLALTKPKLNPVHLYSLSKFCPSEKAVLVAQKTCLLVAAAADLEMGNQPIPRSEQVELLSQALQHLQACKEIWKILKLTGDFAKDQTDTLLLLYEFEARSKLNDPELHNFMESVWKQPQIEVKTLEIIASLAIESPACYPELCKKALKSALNLHRKQTVIDVEKFSKCLHSLIALSLPTGLTDLDACVLQEAWDYFEDGLSIISSTDRFMESKIILF
uniref:Protein ZIP4 homolog n=1 Tax=Melopsittacus undulatus TaxID=13146 RepID=A0A8C6JNZ4_MELUD